MAARSGGGRPGGSATRRVGLEARREGIKTKITITTRRVEPHSAQWALAISYISFGYSAMAVRMDCEYFFKRNR